MIKAIDVSIDEETVTLNPRSPNDFNDQVKELINVAERKALSRAGITPTEELLTYPSLNEDLGGEDDSDIYEKHGLGSGPSSTEDEDDPYEGAYEGGSVYDKHGL